MAFVQNFQPTVAIEPKSGCRAQTISVTSTTQNYPLGARCTARDPVLGDGEFIYMQGVASTALGDVVQLNPDGTTTRAAGGTAVGHIGVAMSANVANQFGWYCVKGRCLVTIAADISANLQMFLAAAGVADDTVAATKLISGASIAESLNAGGSAIVGTTEVTAASQAVALLQYPYAIKAV
jgi:hypothetical protein